MRHARFALLTVVVALLLPACGPAPGVEVLEYSYSPGHAISPRWGTVRGVAVNRTDRPQRVTLVFEVLGAGGASLGEERVPIGRLGAGETRRFDEAVQASETIGGDEYAPQGVSLRGVEAVP